MEIFALQVLHDEIRGAVLLSEVVYGDDVSVMQLSRGARFVAETGK